MSCFFLSRWKPFGGTKRQNTHNTKELNSWKRALKSKQNWKTTPKTWRKLKKKLDKFQKPKRKPRENKQNENNSQRVLVKHPNFLKSLYRIWNNILWRWIMSHVLEYFNTDPDTVIWENANGFMIDGSENLLSVAQRTDLLHVPLDNLHWSNLLQVASLETCS